MQGRESIESIEVRRQQRRNDRLKSLESLRSGQETKESNILVTPTLEALVPVEKTKKVRILTSDLKLITAIAKDVLPKRPTHPILQYLKLSVVDGDLIFLATDLSVFTTKKIPGINVTDFEVLVEFAELENFVKTLKTAKKSDPIITLDFTNDVCLAYGENEIIFNINTGYSAGDLKVSDYPNVNVNPKNRFQCDSTRLLKAYKSIGYAVSAEETKQILISIQLTHLNGVVRLIATDGHRVAKTYIDQVDGDNFEMTPKGLSIGLATKYLSGVVTIGSEDDSMILLKDNNGFKMVARVNEGRYPDCNRLLPDLSFDRVTFDFKRKELLDFLATASKAVGKIEPYVDSLVTINFVEGLADFIIRKKTQREKVLLTKFIDCNCSQKEFTITFNLKYLKDPVDRLEGDNVVLNCYKKPLRPAVIVEGVTTHLLMPCQVNE